MNEYILEIIQGEKMSLVFDIFCINYLFFLKSKLKDIWFVAEMRKNWVYVVKKLRKEEHLIK